MFEFFTSGQSIAQLASGPSGFLLDRRAAATQSWYLSAPLPSTVFSVPWFEGSASKSYKDATAPSSSRCLMQFEMQRLSSCIRVFGLEQIFAPLRSAFQAAAICLFQTSPHLFKTLWQPHAVSCFSVHLCPDCGSPWSI